MEQQRLRQHMSNMTPIARALLSEPDEEQHPVILYRWFTDGRLDVEGLRQIITLVWERTDHPTKRIGISKWVEMFRTVGFVADDDSPAPTESLRVYRGATWARRRGMSWTTDIERAGWFAARSGDDGVVFQALVEPDAVLAFVGLEGRTEDEVVVAPALLPSLGKSSIVT